MSIREIYPFVQIYVLNNVDVKCRHGKGSIHDGASMTNFSNIKVIYDIIY